MAYENTYKMPIVVVHTMNVFGERQLPSKFIPKVVSSVMEGKEVSQSNVETQSQLSVIPGRYSRRLHQDKARVQEIHPRQGCC